MLNLTRLLMLMAVASLATVPAMACCVTGHVQPAVSQTRVGIPSCHGEQSPSMHGEEDRAQQPISSSDCPGCRDCDIAIVQTQSVIDGALLSQSAPEIPLATLQSQFSGFGYKLVVLKTGPPGTPPATLQTPIALKQRLLI